MTVGPYDDFEVELVCECGFTVKKTVGWLRLGGYICRRCDRRFPVDQLWDATQKAIPKKIGDLNRG